MAADLTPWHTLSSESAAARLHVDPAQGLTPDEAAQRLAQAGPNEIHEQRRRSPLAMFVSQFTDFMILVLIAAAIVAGIVGEPQDSIAIVVILLLNAVIGFIQEYRAERAVAALQRLAAASARVRRGGQWESVTGAQLAPGDVVWLEAGNVVPADLRLIEVAQLKVEEAALTGESHPAEKIPGVLMEAGLPLGDRRNMAYKGTIVSYGRAEGIVVATGMQTELGRIAALLHGADDVKTPLQKRLAAFGQRLALAVLALCAIIFTVGVLRGEPVVLMFLTAVSLAVAAIPEALPAVVTVSLALSAHKMVQRHALIRRLPAVETLGSVTFICSDKTGTLTENRMRVERYCLAGQMAETIPAAPSEAWTMLAHAMALSNDAARHGSGKKILGDPTEVALYQAARSAGFDKADLSASYPRLAEIPFDSERRRMATLHRITSLPLKGEEQIGDGVIVYVKGAPEALLPRCMNALIGSFDADATLAVAEDLAAQGLRVLALAYRELPAVPDFLDADAVEQDLIFLGLVGLIDPPRPEAAEAVALCRTAGITPVMITGDHPATARAIARRLGIIGDEGEVLTGQQLDQLSLAEFEEHVERVRVYARVAPEQKIKIVKALQDKGEFVAMTGDGVNDAPALKRADIGVAMGKGGTDVAREAAHMVLLDDNFATIVSAVREGRRIYDNIRKFVKYNMTGNAGEVWTLFLAPFMGLPIPLLPIHILWVNLLTDGLPGLALAAEPEARGIMQRPPRPPQESIFAHGNWQHMIWVGLLLGAVCVLTQAWAYHTGSAHWQSMVFTVLTLSQMGHVLAIRSERDSLFTQGLFSNKLLLLAIGVTFALQMAVLYVPALNPIFKTEPLTLAELGLCLMLSSVVFIAVEIEKMLVRRGLLYAPAS
ncbi:MAG: cation-translocating P-type ATPase [Hydrogenophilales bacterium]|nr:cation-translocating P-type ATPase [Hydrogenophilales bacterium]